MLSTPAALFGNTNNTPKAYFRYVRFRTDSTVAFEQVVPVDENAENAWQELMVEDVATKTGMR